MESDTTKPAIVCKDLCFSFNEETRPVINHFSLEVGLNEVISLFGPNGSGKTTLLKMFAGLLNPVFGDIEIFGSSPPSKEVGYIPQAFSESLLPWISSEENIKLPLRIRKESKKRIVERFDQVTGSTCQGVNLNQGPYKCSIGQQQKIALARALITSPKLLLADEPFSALDQTSHKEFAVLLQKLLSPKNGISAVIVTHNIEDAVFLSDRVIGLSDSPAGDVSDFKIDIKRPREASFRSTSEFADLCSSATRMFLQSKITI